MRYYISDLHFFHDNLNKAMDMRGFESLEAMHEYMIAQWNSVVRKNDEVVILGDFSIGKGRETNEILSRLSGKKYLVTGNHDKFLKDKEFDASAFKWVGPYLELNDNGRKVIMCHYPIMCYNHQYLISKAGNAKTYMLYGHVHNTYDEILLKQFKEITRENKREIRGYDEPVSIPCNMINVFCMRSDYKPLNLDKWIELEGL